jgi:hypothetical protein
MMKKVLFIFIIFCFSLNIISCSSSDGGGSSTTSTTTDNDTTSTTDTTAPVIAEVTSVTTPFNDSTPNYTFSSTEAGTITYGGSCSSGTTSATSGNNTITFNSLNDGTYADCTILVKDSLGNVSNTLTITSFTIETTAPTVSSIYPIENHCSILINDNISVTFSESIDITSVTTNTSNTSCSGSIELSSDNFSNCVKMSATPSSSNSDKTFKLDPRDNLSVSTNYKIRVKTAVKDTQGNTMSSQYETATGFTTRSSDNVTLQGRCDGKGVDLVITGDGFNAGQMDSFYTAAQSYIDYMFAYDDNITNHKNGWNVHRLDAISETDCIDYSTSDNVSCSTESAYGAYYWCNGMERLLCINASTVISKVSTVFPQYDNVIILVNSTKYGGAGYSGYGLGTASLNSASNNVALHEMGHSFAGLADEYTYGGTSAPSSEPSQPNVTINNDNTTVKWNIWMDDQNAVLCGQNSLSCIGLFEGGNYVETGVWRPVYNSIMRGHNKPFYVVNMEAWTMAVYQALTTTYYSKTPSSSIVSHAQGSTLNYSIELAIDNSSQQVDWYVDNVSSQKNSTSFSCCDNKTDNYTVTAKIWDWTGVIRKDNSTSSSTINWSVTLQ